MSHLGFLSVNLVFLADKSNVGSLQNPFNCDYFKLNIIKVYF